MKSRLFITSQTRYVTGQIQPGDEIVFRVSFLPTESHDSIAVSILKISDRLIGPCEIPLNFFDRRFGVGTTRKFELTQAESIASS